MSGPRIRVAPKEARTLDGITFDSKAEMNRYAELKMLERAGVIEGLELQPKFILQDAVDGRRAITYFADFGYREKGKPRRVIEDVKGHKTEVYRLKKKLLLAKYPDIDFREIKA